MKTFEITFAPIGADDPKRVRVIAQDFDKAMNIAKTDHAANFKKITKVIEIVHIPTLIQK